jgi:hypothetical protein
MLDAGKGVHFPRTHRLLCFLSIACLYSIFLTVFHLIGYSHQNHLRVNPRRHNELEQMVTEEVVSRYFPRLEIFHPSDKDCAAKAKENTVHVAFVVVGDTRKFLTAINSLYLSRLKDSCTYIVLHVLTDQGTLPALQKSTVLGLRKEGYKPGNAPHHSKNENSLIVANLYMIEPFLQFLPETVKTRNLHYSGVPAMLKLMYERILPQSVQSVIALDSDVLILRDLIDLWKQRKHLVEDGSALFSMAFEQSEWYKDQSSKLSLALSGAILTDDFHLSYRWPHVGRGFNSGVILMDLKAMRKTKWETLWKNSYFKVAQQHPKWKLQLGDQDVFNACIHDHPSIALKLPCGWNLQDAGLKTSSLLCKPRKSWSIVHFNFFAKRQSFWAGLLNGIYKMNREKIPDD